MLHTYINKIIYTKVNVVNYNIIETKWKYATVEQALENALMQ